MEHEELRAEIERAIERLRLRGPMAVLNNAAIAHDALVKEIRDTPEAESIANLPEILRSYVWLLIKLTPIMKAANEAKTKGSQAKPERTVQADGQRRAGKRVRKGKRKA